MVKLLKMSLLEKKLANKTEEFLLFWGGGGNIIFDSEGGPQAYLIFQAAYI